MGNTLTSFHTRLIIFLLLVISSSITTVVALPYTRNLLSNYTITYYRYKPSKTVTAAEVIRDSKPAKAVPLLMYHGVVKEEDGVNTEIANFIEQMEKLKNEGYQTISVREFDLFHQGKFELPAKPIIITFDDGRKDSYYNTDDVLRQLGFKATMFVATGPIIEGNSFYLTWEELKKMKESGRWEIEAHGRYSHEKIPINEDPETYGRYLTSRMYLAEEKRIETVAEFEKRVEDDYSNSINDLKKNVGVTPQYFSIPLNDYGKHTSNHPDSVAFNEQMMKKYFRLGFVQANSSVDPSHIIATIYNFNYTNPYTVRRLEVANLPAKDLIDILAKRAPTAPRIILDDEGFRTTPFNQENFSGKILYLQNGLSLSAEKPGSNGQVIFGKDYWRGYEASATIEPMDGRSTVLLFNFQDGKNYLALSRTGNTVYLRQTVKGVTSELAPAYYIGDLTSETTTTFTVKAEGGFVDASINGHAIFEQIPIPLQNGAVGFRVWDREVTASAILQKLWVRELDQV